MKFIHNVIFYDPLTQKSSNKENYENQINNKNNSQLMISSSYII
jgi:hypothetical protein